MSRSLLVMLVEDHDELREATVDFLLTQGYDTVGVSSAEEVDDTPVPRAPDLYVIDLNLPGEDGFSLTERLRRTQPLAGIIITTARSQLQDRLTGYANGADIYLPKPVDPLELAAALKSVAQRTARDINGAALQLNSKNLVLAGPSGKVNLTESEGRLLTALASARHQTLERWQVAVQLQPNKEDLSPDRLQNRISLLRRKIQACGIEGEAIKAVRGTGYKLCTPTVVV
jgi:DNA-binding response OmpR family regulator